VAKLYRAIGLMSGTSLDGIDVALLTTDGEDLVERGPSATVAYPEAFRVRLRQGLVDAREIRERRQRPGTLAALDVELGERHGAAVRDFLQQHAIDRGSVDVIGFHGQTVLHRPLPGGGVLTVQLGDGEALARATGIDVIYDLRAADVAAGGQGAPLAPVYHRAIAAKAPQRPLALLNVGGVANVTWIGRQGELVAFDTGPGNALIDDWALRHTGEACDTDGRLAAAGRVDEGMLTALLRDPYFAALPPKSLDRNSFTLAGLGAISPADGAATLTAFTAAAVRRALEHLPEWPALWLVCGGGRRNRVLMAALAERLEAPVAPVEALSFGGDAIEAEAWAYLAVRSLRRLPLSYPGTTGVTAPTTGGVLASAAGN
jgi:anhydro-N-acetylmuramic acid kinase